MHRRHKAYHWWKRKPSQLRKPLVFTLGVLLIIVAPIIGSIPGPGGIVVFLAGIALLATEFDWAENVQAFFLTTLPSEVKKRWQPTPLWQLVFDVTAGLLLALALTAAWLDWWWPVISLTAAGVCLWVSNRQRLSRLKSWLKRPN